MDAITGMQASLARKAKEVATHRFADLWPLMCREEWIRYALDQVLTNTGAKTPGLDGTTREHLKEEQARNQFVQELQHELKGRTYQPSPAKRRYIPKTNGQLRPIGILTMKDRTVQMLLKMVMEPIWESDFLPCSHGFRLGHRTMDCIATIYQRTNPRSKMYWAVEGDVRGCFDNVHHTTLMHLIEKRIRDHQVLRLLEQFLTAGIMEKQLFIRTQAGTQQGGIVSPLLANIYLHQLDCYWWENYGNLKPYERRKQRKQGQGSCHLTRYADDFLLLCNGPKADAERIKAEFGAFIQEELKLELSPEKTLITHINDGYTFLGFHIRRFTNPKEGNQPVVLVFPSTEGTTRFKDKVRRLTAMNRIADPLDTLKAYNRLAHGWAHYYRYVNAKDFMNELDQWAFRRLLFWLARHHGTGPKGAWARYVHRQAGRIPGTTRKNLAVRDNEGKLQFRYNMSDLEIKRYSWKRRDNPYLTGEVPTTITEPETADLPGLWVGYSSTPHAQWRGQRREKLEESGYRCERCGNQINLEVNHLKPAKGRERGILNHPPEWLEVLCETCHHANHQKQNG